MEMQIIMFKTWIGITAVEYEFQSEILKQFFVKIRKMCLYLFRQTQHVFFTFARTKYKER